GHGRYAPDRWRSVGERMRDGGGDDDRDEDARVTAAERDVLKQTGDGADDRTEETAEDGGGDVPLQECRADARRAGRVQRRSTQHEAGGGRRGPACRSHARTVRGAKIRRPSIGASFAKQTTWNPPKPDGSRSVSTAERWLYSRSWSIGDVGRDTTSRMPSASKTSRCDARPTNV